MRLFAISTPPVFWNACTLPPMPQSTSTYGVRSPISAMPTLPTSPPVWWKQPRTAEYRRSHGWRQGAKALTARAADASAHW